MMITLTVTAPVAAGHPGGQLPEAYTKHGGCRHWQRPEPGCRRARSRGRLHRQAPSAQVPRPRRVTSPTPRLLPPAAGRADTAASTARRRAPRRGHSRSRPGRRAGGFRARGPRAFRQLRASGGRADAEGGEAVSSVLSAAAH